MDSANDSSGKYFLQRAHSFREDGADVNQVANLLVAEDSQAADYGIGVILDGHGRPMPTSPELMAQTLRAVEQGVDGTYLSSKSSHAQLLEAVVSWQRIPYRYWSDFVLVTPSDAGTGAVNTAVALYQMLNPKIGSLAVEERSWPVYQTIAAANRLDFSTYDLMNPAPLKRKTLTVTQAAPHNSTGYICSKALVEARAAAAAKEGQPIILDRAYPGFEQADLLSTQGYDSVMRRSCEHYLLPYMRAGCSFAIALSPTKAFRSFALRPCGFTLVYEPDPRKRAKLISAMTVINRSRGSAFEHPASRALVYSFIARREILEDEHAQSMQRLADSQKLWQKLLRDHPLSNAFSSQYAGMFRNLAGIENFELAFYEAHMFPVIAGDRCRINVTGIPIDETLAQSHLDVFTRLLRCD